jgi:uncharacterized membrane protein
MKVTQATKAANPAPEAPAAGPALGQKRPGLYQAFTNLMTREHAHPVAVHLPNGVLPAAIVLFGLGAVFQRQALLLAGYYNLMVVAAAMAFVLFSGYVDWTNHYGGHMTWVFRHKIIAGFLTAALSLILAPGPVLMPALVDPLSPRRWLFLGALLVNLAPAAYAGWLGGKLVFGARKK